MRTGAWFQTFSGTQFYLTDPHPDDVSIEDIAHALGSVGRFGGHTRQFYSVGQHSVHCCDLVAEWHPDNYLLQLYTLLHDASEAYLGDVVRPLKYAMPNYRQFESRMMDVIYQGLKLAPPLPDEEAIVKCADDILLMTERRDLINHRNIPWSVEVRDIEPHKDEIQPWTPVAAEVRFNQRYLYLRARVGCQGLINP